MYIVSYLIGNQHQSWYTGASLICRKSRLMCKVFLSCITNHLCSTSFANSTTVLYKRQACEGHGYIDAKTQENYCHRLVVLLQRAIGNCLNRLSFYYSELQISGEHSLINTEEANRKAKAHIEEAITIFKEVLFFVVILNYMSSFI